MSDNVRPAPIVAVTVLEDRASITRRASVPLGAGQQRIVIDRVSPVLADKTLTATATNARVLDVRCERYVAPWREGDPGEVTALRAQRTELQATHAAAAAKLATARVEAEALGQLCAAALADLATAAARGIAASDAADQLAALDAQEATARARRVELELEVNDRAAVIARLDERIGRAEDQAGEQAARLSIDLIAEAPGDAIVTVTYVVPGAAWRPYHRAHLRREAGNVEWQTTACVWQSTGEDWTDAELTCSLERPSLGIEPPKLEDDELRTRKKPDQVVVEAREQELQTAGLGGAGPLQVPGIDDGGLGLRLSAGRVTVKSDGAPHRVAVGGFTAPAQVSLVSIPLRSSSVHVRATFANTGTLPLLAGPVDLIMSSGYVGRGEVELVAPGEKVELGFGPDSDIRVHRTEKRDRDEAGLLGGWNVQTVQVVLRISNLGAQRAQLTVTDRVPVSEIEQVEIQTSGAKAYLVGEKAGEKIEQVFDRQIDDRGIVTWTVDLPPLGRRVIGLEYKIRSQRGVAGV